MSAAKRQRVVFLSFPFAHSPDGAFCLPVLFGFVQRQFRILLIASTCAVAAFAFARIAVAFPLAVHPTFCYFVCHCGERSFSAAKLEIRAIKAGHRVCAFF